MRIPGDPQEGLAPKVIIVQSSNRMSELKIGPCYCPEIASNLYSDERSQRFMLRVKFPTS